VPYFITIVSSYLNVRYLALNYLFKLIETTLRHYCKL